MTLRVARQARRPRAPPTSGSAANPRCERLRSPTPCRSGPRSPRQANARQPRALRTPPIVLEHRRGTSPLPKAWDSPATAPPARRADPDTTITDPDRGETRDRPQFLSLRTACGSIVAVESVGDVDAEAERLRGLGVEFLSGPVDRPWGHRTLHLLDPDGFVVELAQNIPRLLPRHRLTPTNGP